jgi:hypothetical protein
MSLEKKRKCLTIYALPDYRTSSYSTILTAYWDQPAPSYFNGSEDTPEYERRKKVGFLIYASVSDLFIGHLLGLRHRPSPHHSALVLYRRTLAGSRGRMWGDTGYADSVLGEGRSSSPSTSYA